MKAEDTIMKELSLGPFMKWDEKQGCAILNINDALKKQAEVSFKAGMREAIDFLKTNNLRDTRVSLLVTYFAVDKLCWGQKLKEWGIE